MAVRFSDSSRRAILGLLLGSALLAPGCAHGITPTAHDQLLDIAVHDLECQPASLTIAQLSIDGTLQQAEGCDKLAVYVLEGDRWRRREPRRHDIRAWAAGRHAQERCRNVQQYTGTFEQGSPPTDCADPNH